jgi:hypothetical protein
MLNVKYRDAIFVPEGSASYMSVAVVVAADCCEFLLKVSSFAIAVL